ELGAVDAARFGEGSEDLVRRLGVVHEARLIDIEVRLETVAGRKHDGALHELVVLHEAGADFGSAGGASLEHVKTCAAVIGGEADEHPAMLPPINDRLAV